MSSKERRDDSFIKKPIYPGGRTAYRKFIKDNLKYPKEAQTKKIEGTVFLKYTINHTGKVIDAKVIKGIGGGCNEEAQRLLKLLKFEIPKNPRKLRILFHQRTQITFRLPKEKKKKVTPKKPLQKKLSMVYNYTTPKKAKPQPKQRKRSYGYTITIK